MSNHEAELSIALTKSKVATLVERSHDVSRLEHQVTPKRVGNYF